MALKQLVPAAQRKMPVITIGGEHYRLFGHIQDREDIGNFNSVTPWTILGNDTDNLSVAPEHIYGTGSLQFDKVDGLAGTVFAGASCTITSLDLSRFTAMDQLCASIYVSDDTNVAYARVRMGTAAGHCNEWQFDDAVLNGATAWNFVHVPLGEGATAGVGNGWDMSAIVYLEVAVAFDGEANALAELRWDHLQVIRSHVTTT